MKKLPDHMLSEGDRQTQEWARQKRKAARQLREAEKKLRQKAADELVSAARDVIRKWPTNKLAAAVRKLDRALENYEKETK